MEVNREGQRSGGELEGKIALITGATSGIGEAMALLFAREGATVLLTGRNRERGEKLQTLIRREGGSADWFPCDVSQEAEVTRLKESVSEKYGRLDILCNNAGIWEVFKLPEFDEKDLDRVFSANTYSVMYMTREFMPMLAEAEGVILNTASIGGLQSHCAGRSQYIYASSKAAVIQFSQLCALNYAPQVRVNCLCPGPTDTPIYINKDYSRFYDSIPMHRVGKPEETAQAALFLCSDRASYITGAVLTVDGGASLL